MLNKAGLWAIAMVLPLTACVSLTPQSPALPDIAVPAAWSANTSANTTANMTTISPAAANGNLALAQWWQRFNDPLLDALITRALEANTSIKSAQAVLLQARALRDVAAAGLLPGVSASAAAQRSKAGHASPGNAFNAGFDASWEPDVFGGKRSALQAGEADAQAGIASLADVQVSIAAEVAVAYIQYRGAQARLAIAHDNLASQLETLQITDWRVQAGLLTSLEGEQERAATEQTRALIPALETSVAQIRHSLALLCGQTPDAWRVQPANLSPSWGPAARANRPQ